MKLGKFDEQKAIDEAVFFLSKSIATLSSILGIDINTFDPSEKNPYQESDVLFFAYAVLQHEATSLNKILGSQNEQH
jgi:hypothetical protein